MTATIHPLCPHAADRHDPDRILDDVARWLAVHKGITASEVLSWVPAGSVSPAHLELAARMESWRMGARSWIGSN